jgi:hypothetical protein
MTTNKKPATAGDRAGLGIATSKSDFTSTPDPVQGWFALGASVKASRNRRPKRGWIRQGGRR